MDQFNAARQAGPVKSVEHSAAQTLSDSDLRDVILLGVAGTAIAAALGFAYHRRPETRRT